MLYHGVGFLEKVNMIPRFYLSIHVKRGLIRVASKGREVAETHFRAAQLYLDIPEFSSHSDA